MSGSSQPLQKYLPHMGRTLSRRRRGEFGGQTLTINEGGFGSYMRGQFWAALSKDAQLFILLIL